MITIEEYNQAKKRIDELHKEEDALREKQEKQTSKIRSYYWEMERALNDRKEKELDEIHDRHKEQDEELKTKKLPHATILSEYEKILLFMEIYKLKKSPSDFTVYRYSGHYPDSRKIPYKPIDTIKNDKYAKIQAFIVSNRKPKNSFSLIIAGRTIFYERIIKPPYSYGCDCHHDGTNIFFNPRDRPTENELKEYYEKNKHQLLKTFIEEHHKVEVEYEEVREKTNNKQWEIEYWENKREYYEHHYNRGTETKEYRQVLKQLKKLKGIENGTTL